MRKLHLILLLSLLAVSALSALVVGADMSSLPSLERSGVVFHDQDGRVADPMAVLADSGVNCIRVRVWVDPFDKDGLGYGGGDCGLDNAVAIGRRAAALGLGLMVDFHYSDFWADPSRQTVPKAWAGLSVEELAQTVYSYTYDSLKLLEENGISIDYVQIGNEINNGLCGINGLEDSCVLLASASRAVRDSIPAARVVVHFTDPGTFDFGWAAGVLEEGSVDYDVFATSYYAYWHGGLDGLVSNLGTVVRKYGKSAMIAETAWPYTSKDTDGHPDSVCIQGASVQGQISMFLGLAGAMADLGPFFEGLFYWEPAWIRVPAGSLAERRALWERFGSGWASSRAAEYDVDAGLYHGGSATDTQALFDGEGHPLESVSMFSLVQSCM